MAKVFGAVLFLVLANTVAVGMFGYPIVYCAGRVLLAPVAAFFEIAWTIAIWGTMGAILLQRWIIASGLFVVLFCLQFGGEMLRIASSGYLC